MKLVRQIQEYDKKRYKIILEDRTALLLYKKEVKEYKICEGQVIPQDMYYLLMKEVLPQRAKKRSLYLLQKQPYTENKLREKLQNVFYPEDVIEEAVSYVKEFGYINDLQYAEQYILFHIEKEPRRRIEYKLLQKGVDQELIRKAFQSEVVQEHNWEEVEVYKAIALLKKRGYNEELSDLKEKKKQYEYLLRKGFSSSVIKKAMEI